MRKIVVTEFISLDGVIEDPGGSEKKNFEHEGWTWEFHNEEIEQFKQNELESADALLLGRVTYEAFAAVWPTMQDTGDFGERFNNYPKHVVSSSLKTAEWNNSHIINGNIAEKVGRVKQEAGKDILVFGSAKLAQTLMAHTLVDEYRLLVYPIVLGSGKRLFTDTPKTALKLVESKSFASGVVLLKYHPA